MPVVAEPGPVPAVLLLPDPPVPLLEAPAVLLPAPACAEPPPVAVLPALPDAAGSASLPQATTTEETSANTTTN